MQTRDDEQFEVYLRGFHPLVPDALPMKEFGCGSRRRFEVEMWVASSAAVVIVAVVGVGIIRYERTAIRTGSNSAAVEIAPIQPLTMRTANALLSTAPSYKAAVDSVAFGPKSSAVPSGQQSAISVLAQEKIKL